MLKVARSLPILLVALLAAACEPTSSLPDDDNGGEEVGEGHQAIDDFVNSIDDLVLPDAQTKTEVDCQDASCPQDGQEGDEYCSYTHYSETAHYDKFVAFQPNSATLWPGNVVKGADAQMGLLTPVGVKLAPVTFSVSLENLANSPVGKMDEPSLSAFRDARNAILAGGVTGATPAALDFDILEVNSQSQIAVALGAGITWPGGPEIAGSFDFVLMDCAPSLGVLTLNALSAATEVFIPLQPHFLALHGLSKLLETTALVAKRINPGLRVSGIVLCLYEGHTRLTQEVVKDLQSYLERSRGSATPWAQACIFTTRIRRNIKLAECPSFGQSIFQYAPSCNGAEDYAALARDVLGEVATVVAARVVVEDVLHRAPAPAEPANVEQP